MKTIQQKASEKGLKFKSTVKVEKSTDTKVKVDILGKGKVKDEQCK